MSDIEYEGKILAVNVERVTGAIERAGGKFKGDYTFRRYVFDVVPAKEGTWVRLRTNGKETTLAVKEVEHDGVDGTSEWEVTVSDFDSTLKILQKSGHSPKGYQENRRVEFSLENAMISIDYWPQLQPYLEIEAESKEAVERVAKKLGFDPAQLVGDNTIKLYAQQGIDLNKIAELKF